MVISKIVEHGSPIPVSKTEVLKNESNPVWKPVSLSVQQVGSKVTREILVSLLEEEGVVTVLLCNNFQDTPLVIECLDFNGNGNHNLIG